MILRTLSSSRKYRRLTLLAKAALSLLLAWSDDQGRIEVDAEQLKMRALLGLHECSEEQVPALFEEYSEVEFGILYEYGPGKQAFQWYGWVEAQPLRTYRPSDIPPPAGWQDVVKAVTEEEWYKRRQQERQVARELGILNTKGGDTSGRSRLPTATLHPADEIELLRGRYAVGDLKWIDEVISAIRTEKPPTDAELVAEYKMWDRFPQADVAAACQTFWVKMYHKEGRGFDYLRGILKRWGPGDQAPGRRETKDERRSGLITLLINQSYGCPTASDTQGLKQFRIKLVDLLIADAKATRISALNAVKELRVEDWSELNSTQIEARAEAAVKHLARPQPAGA